MPQLAPATTLREGSLDEVTRDAITPHYRRSRDLVDELLAERLPPDLDRRSRSGAGGCSPGCGSTTSGSTTSSCTGD
ncbi:hypothetical protein P8A22_19290 [Streptomyces laculatispora]|uniref:Uncharacterized protein n=1 Tax=Streptomyces laculatispora TaxID=887464 RepID=A0ABY9I5L0_9ACTN|nr:hypothetical protein [Streptomyces laculatispora]WLQ41919.1 hypothetical protein P8A22_19290 [Streptomyces laculatispora]